MSRVILSMTTIPERLGTYDETFDSIEAQTRKPDFIFVAGVDVVCDWMFHDSNKGKGPADVDTMFKKSEDRGPVTKLSILEESWLRDDDIIVTIDDDIIYEPTWLETLVAEAEKDPDHAIGFSGWNASGFIEAWGKGLHGDYVFPRVPGPCDVVEGWAGVAYRRKFFYVDPVMGFASVLHPLPMFKYVDDVWISWHLERRGVGRRLIGPRLARERDDNTPGLHNRPDFMKMNRDASIVAFAEAAK